MKIEEIYFSKFYKLMFSLYLHLTIVIVEALAYPLAHRAILFDDAREGFFLRDSSNNCFRGSKNVPDKDSDNFFHQLNELFAKDSKCT